MTIDGIAYPVTIRKGADFRVRSSCVNASDDLDDYDIRGLVLVLLCTYSRFLLAVDLLALLIYVIESRTIVFDSYLLPVRR